MRNTYEREGRTVVMLLEYYRIQMTDLSIIFFTLRQVTIEVLFIPVYTEKK